MASRSLTPLMLSWLVVAHGGCPGKGPGVLPDRGSATVDASRLDGGAIDAASRDGSSVDATARDATARDATARDSAVRDATVADKGPCGQWVNWSCNPDEALRCIASCDRITPTRVLSCNAAGSCICGAGVEPCGQFPMGSEPCDTCRSAVEGDCCFDL